MNIDNPFANASSQQNVGGILSLRLYFSSDIVQQALQTECKIDQLTLLYRYAPLAEWRAKDHLSGELKFSEEKSEKGRKQSFDFVATVESDISPSDFEAWFSKIKGKNLCVVVENVNGFTRCFNPYHLNYTYVGVAEHSQRNRFELSFVKAKFREYEYINVLGDAKIERKLYPIDTTNTYIYKVEVRAKDSYDIDLYKLYYATTNSFAEAKAFVNNPESFLSEGTYYIFAVNKTNPSIVFSQTIIVNPGTVTN